METIFQLTRDDERGDPSFIGILRRSEPPEPGPVGGARWGWDFFQEKHDGIIAETDDVLERECTRRFGVCPAPGECLTVKVTYKVVARATLPKEGEK